MIEVGDVAVVTSGPWEGHKGHFVGYSENGAVLRMHAFGEVTVDPGQLEVIREPAYGIPDNLVFEKPRSHPKIVDRCIGCEADWDIDDLVWCWKCEEPLCRDCAGHHECEQEEDGDEADIQ